MSEFIDVLFKGVGVIALAFVTYVIVPAIRDWRKNKLTASQQEQLSFWVDTGVRWAKQWLQSETGEVKKEQVMAFVKAKVKELGLPYSDEDIDKSVEAAYSAIKDVIEVTSGKT